MATTNFIDQTTIIAAAWCNDVDAWVYQGLPAGGVAPTTGSILRATGTATYAWTAAVYPTTTTINQILYSSATNTITGLATQASSFLTTTAGGVPQWTSGTPYLTGGTDVALADGGTNASLVASNGGIFYSTSSAGAILSGTGTAGKVLQSGASTAPTWSTPTYPSASGAAGVILRSDGTNNIYTTATYPATTTINRILYSSAGDVIGQITTANSGVLVTSGGGVPSIATDIPTAVTIGGAAIYRAGGTDVAIADGGTGVSSSNPLIQRVSTQTGAVATGTTQMPGDDTIPQNTEGDQYMTLAITPKNTNNILEITVNVFFCTNIAANGLMGVALFQDSTAGALAVTGTTVSTSGAPLCATFTHKMTAGTVSATTFKVRIGGNAAGTTTFNGAGGGRLYGGVLASSIIIRETST